MSSAQKQGLHAGHKAGDEGARGGSPGGRALEHEAGHPAPARGDVSDAALWFGIFAAPAAWSIQTLVNYPLASHSCYPGLYPLGAPAFGGMWTVALIVSILAVGVGVAAGLFAYREWTRSRGEVGGSADRSRGMQTDKPGGASGTEPKDVRSALEIGEGRTRFMAMSGILTSITFVIASCVHASALFLVVPPCGQ